MFQGLWDLRIGNSYGNHLLCTDLPHPCAIVLFFIPMFESFLYPWYLSSDFHSFNNISPRLSFSTFLLSIHPFSFNFCPDFINIPYWVVWRSSRWSSFWIPTILGPMTNPTTIVASYSLTVCSSMTNMVACPIPDRVAGISNIPSHITFLLQSFVANTYYKNDNNH